VCRGQLWSRIVINTRGTTRVNLALDGDFMVARARLATLLIILAAVWCYAVATDHPAPAWGASRLPSLLLDSVISVLFCIGGICIYHVVRRPRDSK
jgi:hypothetical protein